MASLPTSSFRAPAELHPLVHAVAKALTRRQDLAEPLRALLASVADTSAPAETLPSLADLVRRLAEVERQVADHGALLATRDALQTSGAGIVQADPLEVEAGNPELDRRILAGEAIGAISRALGIPPPTIRLRRQVLRIAGNAARPEPLQAEEPEGESGAIQAMQTALRAPTVPAEPDPWTIGEGRMKRLTDAGQAELGRRLRAGEPAAAIAEALGVSRQMVNRRRAAADVG